MSTILLLGGYGFIGTNILSYIDEHQLPYEVIVVDRFDQHPLGLRFRCVKNIYARDWADESFIRDIFQSNKIDIVLHSISATIPSAANSAKYDIEANLLPTISILDAMRDSGCSKIVFISSGGAVYSENDTLHNEDENVFPKSTYGVTKLAIEKFIFQYANQYAMQPLVLRLSNPYGRFHTSMKQGIINVAISKAKANEPVQVWGDGNTAKDYIFIEDFCRALFALFEKGVVNEVINIGSGYTYTINQILSLVKSAYPQFTWEYEDRNARDTSIVQLNTDKLKSFVDMEFYRLEDIMPQLL